MLSQDNQSSAVSIPNDLLDSALNHDPIIVTHGSRYLRCGFLRDFASGLASEKPSRGIEKARSHSALVPTIPKIVPQTNPRLFNWRMLTNPKEPGLMAHYSNTLHPVHQMLLPSVF